MKKKIIIIAEAGVNHNGKLRTALKMVDVASKAKADFIKFQTFIPNELSQEKHGLAEYQKKYLKKKKHIDLLKKLALSFEDFKKIKLRCKRRKIKFLSSPFDISSITFLNKLKLDTFKIPSGEINNVPYLKKIASFNKKIILSTGMSNLKEIISAIKIISKNGTNKKKITILHCNSEYPASINQLNLLSIKYLKDKLKLDVGYSDHSLGYEASLMALCFGATVFEKHFTLDKKLKGPDHTSSLSPNELKIYVKKLKLFQESIGKYNKKPSLIEIQNSKVLRKQIFANLNIKKGEKFTINNITTKRGKQGISASKWDKVIGNISKYNFSKDENIKF